MVALPSLPRASRRPAPGPVAPLLLALLLPALSACPRPPADPTSDPIDFPDDDDDSVGDDDDSTGDDDDSTGDDDDTAGDDDDDDDSGDDDDDTAEGPAGFVGSPCLSDSDCDFTDAVCLEADDGFPGGHCSAPCERFCPDRGGHPVTFCADAADFPPGTALGDGDCVSRCDFAYFPLTGCRPDYRCTITARANEASTETYVCLPWGEGDLTDCHLDLAARGVAFEPTIRAVDHPDGRPDLDCEIEDPVVLLSPVLDVEMRYYDGSLDERVLAGCQMAHALADTIDDIRPSGVSDFLHIGTYNCRQIAGSDRLSQHSYANAIDIWGFDFHDGRSWTLIDHWEHDTESFSSDAGAWFYEASQRWHDEGIWNIILTPNYNAAHDNHFHVDLTAGSDFIGMLDVPRAPRCGLDHPLIGPGVFSQP